MVNNSHPRGLRGGGLSCPRARVNVRNPRSPALPTLSGAFRSSFFLDGNVELPTPPSPARAWYSISVVLEN